MNIPMKFPITLMAFINTETFIMTLVLPMALNMAVEYGIYIVIKGHHSIICSPQHEIFINPTGNAGMATAGSGDVLTGIVLGLLARGYNTQEACLMGVFLHGYAGDIAAEQLGMESMMASDIFTYLPMAFKKIEQPYEI